MYSPSCTYKRYYFKFCICRPATAKELFNLRHSQCRNAVERIFGVLKKRFKIIREANEFPIEAQGRIASAICVVHNFIRIHDPEDLPDPEEEDHSITSSTSNSSLGGNGSISLRERNEAGKRRDEIANAMWVQYQEYLRKRGRR